MVIAVKMIMSYLSIVKNEELFKNTNDNLHKPILTDNNNSISDDARLRVMFASNNDNDNYLNEFLSKFFFKSFNVFVYYF
jgi:hypothetical protein